MIPSTKPKITTVVITIRTWKIVLFCKMILKSGDGQLVKLVIAAGRGCG